MYRSAIEKLYQWKESKRRKPLIIEGARQVGKVSCGEVNLKAKSLKTYREKFHPDISVRTSMADYKREEWLVNLPLYAVEEINKSIE